MASKMIRFLTAGAILLSSTLASAASTPITPATEPAPSGQSELDGASGGLLFGAIFTLATVLVILFHGELFDDDDEEPVST